MNLTSGNLYWNKKDKIKKTYPYVTEDLKCDVLVVGGGITGAITAYFLAKEGMNVILCEKNIIGYGSTSATTALLEYQVDIDLYKLEKLIGVHNAKRIYELCLEAIDDIDMIDKELGKKTEFRRRAALYFTNKFMQKGSIVKEYEARKNSGFNVKYVDNNDTLNISAGILSPNSSGDLNPYKFTTELIEYLNKMDNVKIFENTEIRDIKCAYDTTTCLTNNRFRIKSDKIIFCTGFDTLKYTKIPNATLYKTFSLITKPIAELTNLDTTYTGRDMQEPYHYIRFTKDNRIIFGGEDVKINNKMTEEEYMRNLSNDKYNKLFNHLNKLLYNIKEFDIECAFNGTFADTTDTLPVIDELENMPNCFCNLGYGSNGILYSVIGAKMLKDAVKGLYTKDMNMFKINRDSK